MQQILLLNPLRNQVNEIIKQFNVNTEEKKLKTPIYRREKTSGQRNTHKKKSWVHNIRKKFRTTKYSRKIILDPRRHDGTMATWHETLETHSAQDRRDLVHSIKLSSRRVSFHLSRYDECSVISKMKGYCLSMKILLLVDILVMFRRMFRISQTSKMELFTKIVNDFQP